MWLSVLVYGVAVFTGVWCGGVLRVAVFTGVWCGGVLRVDSGGNVHGCRIICAHTHHTLRPQTWCSAPIKMLLCAHKRDTLRPQT